MATFPVNFPDIIFSFLLVDFDWQDTKMPYAIISKCHFET
jgi:hypothetical protein